MGSPRQQIRDNYIAVFRDSAVSRQQVRAAVSRLVRQHRGVVASRIFQNALRGFHFRASPQLAGRIGTDRRVSFVQPDYVVTGVDIVAGQQEAPPTWALDRIDQRALPLDEQYAFPANGSGATAYVIDSGIRASHVEFSGRATAAADFTSDADNVDCAGHGTHVAGTIGGQHVGAAKGVRLVGLKVLACDGHGSTSGTIAALDWVVRNGHRPAVVNMSLGHAGTDPALGQAVTTAVDAGFSVVTAAGNSASNACNVSPARSAMAITVGATNDKDSRDVLYSNFGSCVKIFAPGTGIYSASSASDNAYETLTGTSMASPLVAGAVALILGAHPDYSPRQVASCLTQNATSNVVENAGNGSPNRMLYVGRLC
ncbi:S8 family peptidase [Luedemannella flava]|uniref:S8 family peptidase n=1 Tax=Luedemannella flava TaxID=349316 RepID=UPI0031D2D874